MRTIGGYEILGELGRGAQGTVYRARQSVTGAVRAVKVLEGFVDLDAVERFRREAQALARAGGAAVPVHEVGSEAGRLWFAMDLCPGGTLEGRLRQSGKLEWREAARLAASLARSLEGCHAVGLVHRDLKPANVLFDEQGEARVADWGVARDLGRSRLTETGAVLGTPGYMAPEQLEGTPVDARADVFSLGAILHELVTGTRPFGGRTWAEIHDGILRGQRESTTAHGAPTELDAILDRALAPKLDKRTARASLLAEELDALLAGKVSGPTRTRAALLVGLVLALVSLPLGFLALAGLVGTKVPGVASRTPSDEATSAPAPTSSRPSPSRDAIAFVRTSLENGTGPVSCADAPWELVRSSEELRALAAARGVVYALDDVRPEYERAPHGPNATLEAFALLGAGHRDDGASLLRQPGVETPVRAAVVQALAASDSFEQKHRELDPYRRPPIFKASVFTGEARAFLSSLPTLTAEPPRLVATVLAPLEKVLRAGAYGRARRDATEGDAESGAQFWFADALFDAEAIRKTLAPDPHAVLGRLPPALLAAIVASENNFAHDTASRKYADAEPPELLERDVPWARALEDRDPVLTAAALAVRLRWRLENDQQAGQSIDNLAAVLPLAIARRLAIEPLLDRARGHDDEIWAGLVRHDLDKAFGIAHAAVARLGPREDVARHGDEAIRLFQRALASYRTDSIRGVEVLLDRKAPEDARNLTRIALFAGRRDAIDETTVERLKKHPLHGELLRLAGKPREALAVLEGAENDADTAGTALDAERALAFTDAGDLAQARACLEEIRRLDDATETGIPAFPAGKVRAYVAGKAAPLK